MPLNWLGGKSSTKHSKQNKKSSRGPSSYGPEAPSTSRTYGTSTTARNHRTAASTIYPSDSPYTVNSRTKSDRPKDFGKAVRRATQTSDDLAAEEAARRGLPMRTATLPSRVPPSVRTSRLPDTVAPSTYSRTVSSRAPIHSSTTLSSRTPTSFAKRITGGQVVRVAVRGRSEGRGSSYAGTARRGATVSSYGAPTGYTSTTSRSVAPSAYKGTVSRSVAPPTYGGTVSRPFAPSRYPGSAAGTARMSVSRPHTAIQPGAIRYEGEVRYSYTSPSGRQVRGFRRIAGQQFLHRSSMVDNLYAE